MNKIILISVLLLMPGTALATGSDTAETPKIDQAACQNLVEYQEPAGVEYQPGVDVNGNSVAPADLPGQPQLKLPKKIQIPLTISLVKALNLDATQYPASQLGAGTEMNIGTITVEGNKVSLNGQPLSDDQQAKLSALCQKQWGVHGP